MVEFSRVVIGLAVDVVSFSFPNDLGPGSLDILVNVLTLTGLMIGVIAVPADDVLGTVLPALGVALILGNLYYTFLARRRGRAAGLSTRFRTHFERAAKDFEPRSILFQFHGARK